jgi:hypothetical protein
LIICFVHFVLIICFDQSVAIILTSLRVTPGYLVTSM